VAGIATDSPIATPIRASAAKLRTVPDRAVIRLHTARHPAIAEIGHPRERNARQYAE
jgi:hypothetical protein